MNEKNDPQIAPSACLFNQFLFNTNISTDSSQ